MSAANLFPSSNSEDTASPRGTPDAGATPAGNSYPEIPAERVSNTIKRLKGPLFAAYMAGRHFVSRTDNLYRARASTDCVMRKWWTDRAREDHRWMQKYLREATQP
jgi:hypothetical protein